MAKSLSMSTLTIMGHEISFEIDVNQLTNGFDETMEQISDAIVDGYESGTVNLGEEIFSWWVKNGKDEEIENLAFENKQMAQALNDMGFSQDKIDSICSGHNNEMPKVTFIYQYNRWFEDESRVLFGAYVNKSENEIEAIFMDGFEELYNGFKEDVYKNGENQWITDRFNFGVSIEEISNVNTFGEQ